MKTCNKCNKQKPLDNFPKHPGVKIGRSAICKPCKVESAQTRLYNLTTAQALKITKNCHLCNRLLKNKKVCIDHDHQTGLVRGILCSSCNISLGVFGDNIEGIMKVVDYLKNPPMQGPFNLVAQEELLT
jgi:hypothetical protein